MNEETLRRIWEQLPNPPQKGAPIDHALRAVGNPIGTAIGALPSINPLVQRIIAGLGLGQSAVAGSTPTSPVHDMFGNPVEESIKGGKSFYNPPMYPPPGVDPTQWAESNPPPPEQQLAPAQDDPNFVPGEPRMYGPNSVTPEDIQRWDEILAEPNETVVEKVEPKKAAPKPKPKAKPKAKPKQEPLPWHKDNIITGLGPYGNR